MDTPKIIIGTVGGGRYTVTAPIVKEDYGLYLQIEGIELPASYEVDFSNSEHNGTSVTMIGNADGVLIPSQFISSGKDIFAFLYHVGEDYGRTIFKFRIPNKLRPDRTDEEPTPEEQSTIDQAISALNSAVAQTAQDKADADVSAQNASADAERAEEARTDAQNYATQAEQSATSASQSASQASASATASAQSASQSAQIKADVEDLVDDAQASASASAQGASASANSASQASGYAQSASASASSAQGYASQAQTSAQTASTKATEAGTSASTASAKATESAQSATSAQGYAQTAEQAKEDAQTAQGLAESARDDSEQIKSAVQDLADGIDTRLVDVEDDILKAFPTDTASGTIASFTDGADDLPLKSLVVDINPIQDLSHGDPSPENICHISGWSAVNATRTGKNLWKFDASYSPSNYAVLINKQPFYLPVGTYTFSAIPNISSDSIVLFGYHADGTRTEIVRLLYSTSRQSASCTLTKPVVSVFFVSNKDGTISDIQLEPGSTATPYEPYTERSITIDLGQTVYGGRLDVLTGELVIEGELEVFDKIGIDSGINSNINYFNNNSTAIVVGEMTRINFGINVNVNQSKYNRISSSYKHKMCNMAKHLFSHNDASTHWYRNTVLYLFLPTSLVGSTAQSVLDYLISIKDTNPLTLWIPYTTPLTIQLTPNQVNSLLGVNNIWADSGDTTAEYRADTTLYIQRLTEPDADMIANANIQSGKYFMVGNSLYKATANIANGGQITVGTNCTRVSLAQALNEINA